MDRYSSLELLRAFGGALRKELPVETAIPADIKLRLELLRLKEFLSEIRTKGGAKPSLRTAS